MFSNKIIKAIKKISKQLTLIINPMLEPGTFTESLKIAQIIPIYKEGNKLTIDQFNYCQLYQRYLNVLYDDNNLLSEQYGFSVNHSTE